MKLKKYPNFVTTDELQEIQKILKKPRWRYKRFGGAQYFWWFEVLKEIKGDPVWLNECEDIWRTLYDRILSTAGSKYVMYRYIINGQCMNQDSAIHTDFPKSMDDVTTWILYLNHQSIQGGHTVFYDDQDQQIGTQEPVPGLAIEYDSRVRHQGRAPTNANTMRTTLALHGKYDK